MTGMRGDDRECPSPISRTVTNELKITVDGSASAGHLRAMLDAFRTIAVLRSALTAHRDLLLEVLALRHQFVVYSAVRIDASARLTGNVPRLS
jgi:hypothetical protein